MIGNEDQAGLDLFQQVLFRSRIAALAFPLALIAALCGCAKKNAASHAPPLPSGPETGIASWYGYPFHGRAAANGEIYDMEKMTAAHRTLPFGTWVRVTNLGNNKTVVKWDLIRDVE